MSETKYVFNIYIFLHYKLYSQHIKLSEKLIHLYYIINKMK